MLKCKDCCYYDYTEGVPYMHCCFREWGHSDDEVAPCDEETEEECEYNENC